MPTLETAELQVHLYVKDFKRTKNVNVLDRTNDDFKAESQNWFLSKPFEITYAPVAGLNLKFERVTFSPEDESYYSLIVRDGQKEGVTPVSGDFVIADVTDWTYVVGDSVYRASCEVIVSNRNQARNVREQLMKGYGFTDISSRVFST